MSTFLLSLDDLAAINKLATSKVSHYPSCGVSEIYRKLNLGTPRAEHPLRKFFGQPQFLGVSDDCRNYPSNWPVFPLFEDIDSTFSAVYWSPDDEGAIIGNWLTSADVERTASFAEFASSWNTRSSGAFDFDCDDIVASRQRVNDVVCIINAVRNRFLQTKA